MADALREPLRLRLDADPTASWRVTRLQVHEALNQPWRAEVDCAQPAHAPAIAPGAAMTVEVMRQFDTQRQWSGLVQACERLPVSGAWRRWRLSLTSRLARHGIGQRSRVLTGNDAAQAVRALLEQAPDSRRLRVRHDLRSPPPRREQFTQWRESDLAWCLRLLEHEGIALVHEADGVLLTDHAAGFPRLDLVLPWLPPDDETAPRIDPQRRPAVHRWRCRLAESPAHSVVRDWNWRRPQAAIERASDSGGDGPDQREDGAHHRDGDEAGRLASLRAEEARCAAISWMGEADHPALAAGAVLRISAPDEPEADGAWLLPSVEHEAEQAVSGGSATYRCRFTAWPADRQWRPARCTPRPSIGGLVHGVIDGPAGAVYAPLDGDGCYRVRPAFDPDSTATMPVRLLTPYAGAEHGLHLPLHRGTEVLIAHIDGDPDRPVIVGAVPNPEHPSVVNEDNRSACVLRSAGGNQLILEDAVGREVWHEIAARDRRREVAGDDDAQVRGNRSAVIAGSDTQAVQGDVAYSVGRTSSETVAGAKAVTVGGAMQIAVAGAFNETVGALRAEQTGGARLAVVAGEDRLQVGGDSERSVAGDQRESTAGVRQIQAKKLRLAASDELTLACGKASIVLKANGDIVIRGGAISIQGSGTVVVKGSKVAGN